jgi:hypothetical protein
VVKDTSGKPSAEAYLRTCQLPLSASRHPGSTEKLTFTRTGRMQKRSKYHLLPCFPVTQLAGSSRELAYASRSKKNGSRDDGCTHGARVGAGGGDGCTCGAEAKKREEPWCKVRIGACRKVGSQGVETQGTFEHFVGGLSTS